MSHPLPLGQKILALLHFVLVTAFLAAGGGWLTHYLVGTLGDPLDRRPAAGLLEGGVPSFDHVLALTERKVDRFLGEWFAYGFAVLNRLREHGVQDDDVSEVQLWPEHFDPATELGDYEKGERASFGASPGDDDHRAPYLYVSAWSDIDRSNPYWNDQSFNGASLSYEELRAAADPVRMGLDFLLEGYRILHGG